MRGPKARDLRVVVKMASPPPNQYSWVIIDDGDGRAIQASPGRFRTSSLAWDAGVSALALRRGS
jgi:hypothetical protein